MKPLRPVRAAAGFLLGDSASCVSEIFMYRKLRPCHCTVASRPYLARPHPWAGVFFHHVRGFRFLLTRNYSPPGLRLGGLFHNQTEDLYHGKSARNDPFFSAGNLSKSLIYNNILRVRFPSPAPHTHKIIKILQKVASRMRLIAS
jgi:hypothetical protein